MKSSEYTTTYSGMRGVDFNGSLKNGRTRFAHLENMYHDYDSEDGRIESIPGFRQIMKLPKRINAIYMQKNREGQRRLVIHAGNTLYRMLLDDKNEVRDAEKIGTVNDFESHAFSYGYDIYLLDGERMWKIPETGVAIAVGDTGAMPYVPMTYDCGVEYEQRNLLTDRFKERNLISSTDVFTHGSHEVYYRITDADKGFCAAVGINEAFELGPLHIPSYVDIGGEKFRVTEIADGAFRGNVNINALRLNEGIIRIGREAFAGCTSLFRIFGSDTLTRIDDEAFSGCVLLEHLYLGRDFEGFGKDSFLGCTRLAHVYYPGSAEDFKLIENNATVGNAKVERSEIPKTALLDIPLNTPTLNVESVTVSGEPISYTSVKSGDVVRSVIISATDRRAFEGKEVIINGVATPGVGDVAGGSVVEKCRICESFDGRIFLSGNPELPNTVIYSARGDNGRNDPLYFGVYNYFNDGTGAFGVVSMLAAGDSLAVFKSEDDGGGSIFYHTPKSTDSNIIPRVYPVSYVHGGVSALGESISFFDDPVFITRGGLCALDKKTINLERSIACRSHNVNPRLLAEDLTRAKLGKWRGYLVLSVEGRIYLADSRAMFLHESGYYEYEWYYLSGVGSWENATRVYRYASTPKVGYTVHQTPEERVYEVVWSEADKAGEVHYYTIEGGKKYSVYPTEEYEGGTFYPAIALLTTEDDLLIFGTENGIVCVFNNDKRGVAPPDVSEDNDFDADEYKSKYGRRIHPYYYSFHDHTPTYAVRTVLDNCGIPHLTKSTVKHSLAIKMSSSGNGSVVCEVGTDRSGYSENARIPNAEVDFSCFNFAFLAFETASHFTIPISEKEKNWIEKEIAVSSTDGAPIAIYSMSYRFTVKGRIKTKG